MNGFTPLTAAIGLFGLLGSSPIQGKVWISEFVASNRDGLRDRNGDAEDWLELFNDGPEAVDLGGWSLTDEVGNPRKWILPAVSLAPDGYLLIFASGDNRRMPGEELHANFSLAKGGEYLALVRPDGATVEDAYAPAYPPQFEDISFGQSQTGTTETVVVAQGAAGRAGVPASAADFAAEFSGWNSDPGGAFTGSSWRAVSSGVGYDQAGTYGSWLDPGSLFETELFNKSGSIFLRLPFTLADPAVVTQLVLRVRYDDGFIAYLNGVEIASSHAPESPGWDALATAERDEGENDDWAFFPIDLSAVTLKAGDNLLAVHGLNFAVDSPNLLVLPELDVTTGGIGAGGPVYHLTPTPGAANGLGATVLPPLLTEVTSSAAAPIGGADSPPIVVTAKARGTVAPISEVRLYHRRHFNPELRVLMLDDGNPPDELAGDGIFSAEAPTNYGRGTLIRWRVEAVDTAGRVRMDPLYEAPTDSDRYYGTVTEDVTLGSSRIPVLQTFVENESAVDTRGGGRIAIYFLGRFYDNVQMDLHGQSTAGGAFPKKSYDVDFNKGNRFLWKEGEGKVKDINLLTNYADKSKVRNSLAYEFLKRCGSAYHFAFPVRVQRNARFFAVVDLVEDGDDRYLERLGLDGNGALYKMYDRLENAASASKKTRKNESSADLNALIQRLNPTTTELARRRFAYDLLDIPATINYLAAYTVGGITDAGHKNYYMYRDTEGDQEWRPLPWDVDLSAGRRWTSGQGYFYDTLHHDFWNAGNVNRLWQLMYNDSAQFREMYLRRVATLRQEILLPPGTPETEDWYTLRVRELEDLIDPSGVGGSDADWDFLTWGSWGNGFQMRQATNRLLTEWLAQRRPWMFNSARNQNGVPVPPLQPAAPDVTIEEIEVNPVSGNQDEEYIVVKNRENFAVDLSGWTLAGAVDFEFPPGTVVLAGAGTSTVQYAGVVHVARNPRAFRFRQTGPRGSQYRFIVGGYEGQLSARGETIELRNAAGTLVDSETYPGDPTPAQQYLRITEINYHPAPATPPEEVAMPGVISEDFEWIEFLNTGPVPLDLAGVRFTNGIDYAFPAGVILGSGQRLILAKNPPAFALRHPGLGVAVVGPYVGYLSNDGDNLRVVDASGENVLSFNYNDHWYPPTDGGSRTLVLRDEATPWDQFGSPSAWGMSAAIGGTAGAESTGYFVHFNAWQVGYFTAAQRNDLLVGDALANPDGDAYPNWMEYALGLHPFVPDEAVFESAIISAGGEEHLGGLVRRRSLAIDLNWSLETSADAVDWITVANPDAVILNTHQDGTETVSLREGPAIGDPPAKLARMRVEFVP